MLQERVLLFDAGLTRDAGIVGNGSSSSSSSTWIASGQNRATMDSQRVSDNGRRTDRAGVASNVIQPAGGPFRSHLANFVTSPSPLLSVYAETLAWLRQLHAMCACADAAAPLPFPPMTSPPEAPPCYVTKTAAARPPMMQPFDPRNGCWDR